MSGELKGQNVPLILLHGLLGRSSDWRETLRFLPGDLTVIAPDLPGHGNEQVPASRFTMEDVTRWLNARLEALEAERFDVAGYSMGGRIAMHFAFAYPEKCRRLITVSASPGISDATERSARARRDEAWADRFEREPLEEVLADWYEQPVFSSLRTNPTVRRTMISARASVDGRRIAAVMRSLSTGYQPSLWERLTRLRVPVLAIAGELDARYVGIVEQMGRTQPGISTSVLPNTGHVVHFEEPRRLAEEMAGFLGYLPAANH